MAINDFLAKHNKEIDIRTFVDPLSCDTTNYALQILGKILKEFMEVDPSDGDNNARNEDRKKISTQLKQYGLRYVKGGYLVTCAAVDNAPQLEAAPPETVESDPNPILESRAQNPLQKKLVKENHVFIGHGHSPVWRELKDFLEGRLGLQCEEFNSESAAGTSTTERLQQMLERVNFAFLIMTAEEERTDGSVHARDNVIHEAGLFQGCLGVKRAIILKEEGCQEFSNIHGLTHIAFPKNRIPAAFEEIRRVLEREKIILAARSAL